MTTTVTTLPPRNTVAASAAFLATRPQMKFFVGELDTPHLQLYVPGSVEIVKVQARCRQRPRLYQHQPPRDSPVRPGREQRNHGLLLSPDERTLYVAQSDYDAGSVRQLQASRYGRTVRLASVPCYATSRRRAAWTACAGTQQATSLPPAAGN